MVYVKNTDIENRTWAGQVVLPNTYYQIESVEIKKWRTSEELLIDIASGVAVIASSNDGNGDLLNISDALDLLKDTGVKDVNSKNYNFTSNTTEDGKELYTKIHGMKSIITSGQTHTFKFVIPYTEIYFIGAEILVDVLSISDFRVSHPVGGEIEQYGYAVNMGKILYKRESRYAARLPQGLEIECVCTNDDALDLEMGVNFIMHEIRDAV